MTPEQFNELLIAMAKQTDQLVRLRAKLEGIDPATIRPLTTDEIIVLLDHPPA